MFYRRVPHFSRLLREDLPEPVEGWGFKLAVKVMPTSIREFADNAVDPPCWRYTHGHVRRKFSQSCADLG